MKNLVVTLALAFSTLFAAAQNPSVPARIGNRTACTIYVKMMITDISCGLTLSTTYAVPPFGVIATLAPPPGTWYDGALVDDDPTFSGTCYYQKLSVPWALCTSYPTVAAAPSCCGPVLISDWNMGGSPLAPFLVIYQ